MEQSHLVLIFMTILSCFRFIGGGTVLYITPTVNDPCPENSCLTIQQFATNVSLAESNTTLIFRPGNHGLDLNISLSSIDHLALLSKSLLGDPLVNITCQSNAGFEFVNIQRLQIKGIVFFGCGSRASSVKLLTVENCIFEGQNYSGTAMEIDNTTTEISNSLFHTNTADHCLSIFADEIGNISVRVGGALFVAQSSASITNCTFERNSAEVGGAMYVHSSSNVTITESTFISNQATTFDVKTNCVQPQSDSSVLQRYSVIGSDKDVCSGGGIAIFSQSRLTINSCTFNNSKSECVKGGSALSVNGYSTAAIYNSEFWKNNAKLTNGFGGALRVRKSNMTIHNSLFCNNSAYQGGVMYIVSPGPYSTILINGSIFCNNFANLSGGAIATDHIGELMDFGSQFINNRAITGGALSIVRSTMLMRGTILQKNKAQESGGAMYILQSLVKSHGSEICNLTHNLACDGGAIYAAESTLNIFWSGVYVSYNLASNTGGGICLYHSNLNGQHNSVTTIENNRANDSGGGIHAVDSLITMYHNREYSKSPDGSIHFINNTAYKGSGVCLKSNSQIRVQKTGDFCLGKESNVSIYFISNFADFGDAIYVVDETYFDVCSRGSSNHYSSIATADCFIQVLSHTYVSVYEHNTTSIKFTSDNNSNSGSIIVGGLLDRCIPDPHYAEILSDGFIHTEIDGWTYLKLISNINDTNCISSSPVRLCFCTPDGIPDCDYEHPTINVMKGEHFNVSVMAVDQVNHTVKFVTIYASLTSTNSELGTGQSIQVTNNACTPLNFTIFSSLLYDYLIVYPEGPCRNESRSQRKILVKFLPCNCPTGFQSVGNNVNCECECNSELSPYFTGSKCDAQTGMLIREDTSWISYVNDSDVSGYLTYPHCPFDYCLPPFPSVKISLNNVNGADAQCANKRSGILCSVCQSQQNLSLSLCNSHCIYCSDSWYLQMIAIIIGILLAGIVLVATVMLLNLTVASGSLNGLIFYANIVGASNYTLLTGSSSATKFLTILTSWINLEINIGFDICFFKGMDTYWKTWLKLAFPIYVIFLVVLVIIVSKHSMRFSRLISRRNPVASLATLILLSYTILLRNMISILSIAYINLPDGSQKRMWLPDATVEYLEGKHIALFVVALLILLLSIAYTFMLFFWQWLLLYQDRMMFGWVRSQRLYHFVEPYHAPYVTKNRYWTGLLLFVCIALYLIFALNVSGDPRDNLLVIAISIVCIFFLKGCCGEIYKKGAIDKIEMICYLNLGSFSATQLYLLESGKQRAIDASAYISGTVVLVLLFGIIIHHAYNEFCGEGFKKLKLHSNVKNAENIGTNSESIQSLVKTTYSIVEGPTHVQNNEEIHYQRFSEKSSLHHRTKYDPILSKQYGTIP